MAEVISINLRGVIPQRSGIEFVRAEAPNQARPWLILVRYARGGVEVSTGRRLDLDKRVFIDQSASDPVTNEAFRWAAPKIANHVSQELRRRAS
jgi:hypothetical protein